MQKIWYINMLQKWQNIKEHFSCTKEKTASNRKSEDIYWYKSNRVECDEEYIVDSVRNFGEASKNTSRHHLPYMTTNPKHNCKEVHLYKDQQPYQQKKHWQI